MTKRDPFYSLRKMLSKPDVEIEVRPPGGDWCKMQYIYDNDRDLIQDVKDFEYEWRVESK